MVKRIVITGGPGTGKTVLIRILESMGFLVFHEIIREMTFEAKIQESIDNNASNPLAFVQDPYKFNTILLQGRIKQFKSASKLQNQVVFYDRGIPDVLAYMNYFGQPYDDEFKSPGSDLRYDEVIILPPWEAIYCKDNERLENFSEACDIHKSLEMQYLKLGYNPVELEIGDPLYRIKQLLLHLNIDHSG